ncbi:MAG: hypothetical protein ABLQ96_12170 [Candidatus Acidiferrum sp.]
MAWDCGVWVLSWMVRGRGVMVGRYGHYVGVSDAFGSPEKGDDDECREDYDLGEDGNHEGAAAAAMGARELSGVAIYQAGLEGCGGGFGIIIAMRCGFL